MLCITVLTIALLLIIGMLSGIITTWTIWYKYGRYNQYNGTNYYNLFMMEAVALNCNKTSQFESIAAYCNQTNPDARSGRYYVNALTSTYYRRRSAPYGDPTKKSKAILKAYDMRQFDGGCKSECRYDLPLG